MNTKTVPLTEHLLYMQIGMQHIKEKHEQIHALASVLMGNLESYQARNEECYTEYRLAQVLEGMLADMENELDIENRIETILAALRPKTDAA